MSKDSILRSLAHTSDPPNAALALLSSQDTEQVRLTRRDALRAMGLIAAGLFGGCAPVRIALRCYPDEFSRHSGLAERELAAFADTVVPQLAPSSAGPVRVFSDMRFPLHRVRAYFASDLCGRAKRLGASSFHESAPEMRTRVIAEGMRARGVRGRIYRGGVYLVQIAAYAGIYDDAGCSLIDFQGAGELLPLEEQTYPWPERFFARETSRDGNPA